MNNISLSYYKLWCIRNIQLLIILIQSKMLYYMCLITILGSQGSGRSFTWQEGPGVASHLSYTGEDSYYIPDYQEYQVLRTHNSIQCNKSWVWHKKWLFIHQPPPHNYNTTNLVSAKSPLLLT